MREVMAAEFVYRALLDRDVKEKLIYITDTYNRLRRFYPFFPENFSEHIRKPSLRSPAPKDAAFISADYFLIPF